MERTKNLFGNDNRIDGSLNTSNPNVSSRQRSSQILKSNNSGTGNGASGEGANKQLVDLLRSSSATINRTELLNALKGSTRAEINQAISNLLSSSSAQDGASNTTDSANTSSATLTANASSASLSSLASQKQSNKPSRSPNSESVSADEAAPTKSSTEAAANTGKPSSIHITFFCLLKFAFNWFKRDQKPTSRRPLFLINHHSSIIYSYNFSII